MDNHIAKYPSSPRAKPSRMAKQDTLSVNSHEDIFKEHNHTWKHKTTHRNEDFSLTLSSFLYKYFEWNITLLQA